ncbi:MAG: hypothetical protein HKN32_03730 [Flavobacteriales bacterium]|nr:hypothetical protein [Flavobacteriales bacterium]
MKQVFFYLLILCFPLWNSAQNLPETPSGQTWSVELDMGVRYFSLDQYEHQVLQLAEEDWGLRGTEIDYGAQIGIGIRKHSKFFIHSFSFDHAEHRLKGAVQYPVYNNENIVQREGEFSHVTRLTAFNYGFGIDASWKSSTGKTKRLGWCVYPRIELGLARAQIARKYEYIAFSSGESEELNLYTNRIGFIVGAEIEWVRFIHSNFSIAATLGTTMANFDDQSLRSLTNINFDGVGNEVDIEMSGYYGSIGVQYFFESRKNQP